MARKYQVCPRCEGDGTVVNGAVSVWTQSDITDDPDSFQDMLNGVYDVECPACHGKRVMTAEEIETYYNERSENIADTKLYAMESGDPELYYSAAQYH